MCEARVAVTAGPYGFSPYSSSRRKPYQRL